MRLFKNLLLILLASFCLSMTGFSQDILKRSSEGRYVSGLGGFMQMLRNNVKFPAQSAKNNSMGFSVSSIEINPVGEIVKIKIINPVDPDIDALILKTLAGTKGKWMNDMSSAENLLIVVQICFVPFPKETIPLCESPVDYPAFLPPITVVNLVTEGPDPMTDETLADIYNRNRATEDIDSALLAINEMIRRNPFSPELYQLRIALNNKRGNREMVSSDLNRLSDFAGGISLQKLITKFYDRNGMEISEEEAVFREETKDLDNGLKSVTRINNRGDTLEIATLSSVDPEIREGITSKFLAGVHKRNIEYSNNRVNGYVTEYDSIGEPESIALVLNDTIRTILFSENIPGAIYSDRTLFTGIEKMPSFKKGDLPAFRAWVQKKLRLPAGVAKDGLPVTVYLSFIVEQDGSVSDVKVLYAADPLLDAEAIRVVKSSPGWTPGYSSGKPVRVVLTIPVTFQSR